jgi:hypothetical protein
MALTLKLHDLKDGQYGDRFTFLRRILVGISCYGKKLEPLFFQDLNLNSPL